MARMVDEWHNVLQELLEFYFLSMLNLCNAFGWKNFPCKWIWMVSSPFVSVSKFLAYTSSWPFFSSFMNLRYDSYNASLASRVNSFNWIENLHAVQIIDQWVFNIFSYFTNASLHRGTTQRNFSNYISCQLWSTVVNTFLMIGKIKFSSVVCGLPIFIISIEILYEAQTPSLSCFAAIEKTFEIVGCATFFSYCWK